MYLPNCSTAFTSCQGIAGNAFSCTGKLVINEKKCNSPCLIGELVRQQYFWENVKSDTWALSFCLECWSQTCCHRQTDTIITRLLLLIPGRNYQPQSTRRQVRLTNKYTFPHVLICKRDIKFRLLFVPQNTFHHLQIKGIHIWRYVLQKKYS